MNYLEYFSDDATVETALAGAGAFGVSLLRQASAMPRLSIRVVIERETAIARRALESSGIASADIAECSDTEAARTAWEAGKSIATDSLSAVLDLPFAILVEATGEPEIGARHSIAAIEAGKHVGIATKETESVVGPYLTRAALDKGLIFTPLDGDQPALLVDLFTWAQTLGFDIISAGKSSEYDFVWDGDSTIFRNGEPVSAAGIAGFWELADDAVATVEGRTKTVTGVALVSAPDLCEMTNVANAVGLAADIPPLHSPILRIHEVPTVLDLSDNGGLLTDKGRAEVFNCLRKPDEISFAGGVFVVVRCENDEDWAMLAEKGHVVSRGRQSAMIFLPRHLLGLEAPISILDVVMKGMTSGGGRATAPRIDLLGRATQDFRAGHRFTMEGHHREFGGVRPEMHSARPLNGGAVPLYMLPGAVLGTDVAAGELIAFDTLSEIPNETLLRLRLEQDAMFLNPQQG